MSRFHAAPICLAPVLAMAAGAVTVVRAQPNLQAKIVARPLTQGERTAYKLPATLQVSGGLSTVGLGQPVYLEAQVSKAVPASDIAGVTWDLTVKPAGSKAVLADSPLRKDVPIYEPSERLVAQVAGRSLLRPDVVGQYVVRANITMADGATANVAQTFIAATYVGVNECMRCHSGGLAQDRYFSYSTTAHAHLFKEGLEGVASDHYGPGCIGCHTVGYDPNPDAVNGGFDDLANQLKWAFPKVLKPGTWDALPDALKNLGNIQCENCHGPGSVHVSGGFKVGIAVNFTSGACAQCHDAPTHHIKNGEWNNSTHAVATREPSGAGREGCVGCHTGTGFVGKLNWYDTSNTTYSPINCQTCHEPHGLTYPGGAKHLVRTVEAVTFADGTKVTDGGAGMLCMNCHQSRRNAAVYAVSEPASARFGPHHGTQGDMLEGVNGFTYGESIPSSAHAFVVEDTCVGCHMQTVEASNPAFTHAGGHTFKPSWSGDEKNPPQELVGACQNCHGKMITGFDFRLMDYNGDNVIDGVQTEVQHLLDELSSMLPPAGKAKSSLTIDGTWTRRQLQAGYNWQFVHDDGSLGIHNTAYAVGLLKASIADLRKQ